MSVEFWWNEKDKGKQKNYIVTPKCTGLGLNPVLRGGKPTSNRLSHGTACGFHSGDGGLCLLIYVLHRQSQKGMSRDEYLPSFETHKCWICFCRLYCKFQNFRVLHPSHALVHAHSTFALVVKLCDIVVSTLAPVCSEESMICHMVCWLQVHVTVQRNFDLLTESNFEACYQNLLFTNWCTIELP